MRATGGSWRSRGSGPQPERIGWTREACPAQTALPAVERSMDPVDRRAPHNELPFEQLDHAIDRKARAKAAHARRTTGAQAPTLAAGSFGQSHVCATGTRPLGADRLPMADRPLIPVWLPLALLPCCPTAAAASSIAEPAPARARWPHRSRAPAPSPAGSGGVEANRTAERARERLPVTVPEVRRLVFRLVWQPPAQPEHVLHWSCWRRRHQQRAKRSHYRRRCPRHLRPLLKSTPS
jgi:hypothetical protein